MIRLLVIALFYAAAPLLWPVPAQAESRHEGDWIMPALRGVKQDGLEHRVCSLEMDQIILCFEFLWDGGYLSLWVQVNAPDDAGWRFRDGYASDLWVDGAVHGGRSHDPYIGSTNLRLDTDRFLGADRSQYYYYGGDWLFFREVVASPAQFLSNRKSFFHKVTHGQHLRLVHYLEGGKTFETEYDLTGLAPLLTAAFEEAAAMEHKYGKKPAAE